MCLLGHVEDLVGGSQCVTLVPRAKIRSRGFSVRFAGSFIQFVI
jgi:hypothetical protein